MIEPPYTSDFVQLFLPIIENSDITDSLRNEDGKDPVSDFIGKIISANTLLKSDVTGGPLSWIPGMWFTLCQFRLSISCATACSLRLFA